VLRLRGCQAAALKTGDVSIVGKSTYLVRVRVRVRVRLRVGGRG